MMGGDPGMDAGMGEDQMTGGDPGMGENPMMGGDQMADGGMPAEDPTMGGDPMGAAEDKDSQELLSIFNGLSIDDKSAAMGYVRSLSDRDESYNERNGQEAPMSESYVFKKSQIERIHEAIRPSRKNDDEDRDVPSKKTKKNPRSPFSAPNLK